jgi:hypothetical protein
MNYFLIILSILPTFLVEICRSDYSFFLHLTGPNTLRTDILKIDFPSSSDLRNDPLAFRGTGAILFFALIYVTNIKKKYFDQ